MFQLNIKFIESELVDVRKFSIVVIGASAGGLSALEVILRKLDKDIKTPIVIVQHLSADSGDSILKLLKKYSAVELTEPNDKELILDNHIYLAPPGYHLMIESDRTFSLYIGPKENYSIPAIDVLFDTAAEVYQDKTLGIILTGANTDGTKGMKVIKDFGGLTIAQDPSEAQVDRMPASAIDSGVVDYVLTLNKIGDILNRVLKES